MQHRIHISVPNAREGGLVDEFLDYIWQIMSTPASERLAALHINLLKWRQMEFGELLLIFQDLLAQKEEIPLRDFSTRDFAFLMTDIIQAELDRQDNSSICDHGLSEVELLDWLEFCLEYLVNYLHVQ